MLDIGTHGTKHKTHGNVHDVALPDEHTGVVDGAGQQLLEHLHIPRHHRRHKSISHPPFSQRPQCDRTALRLPSTAAEWRRTLVCRRLSSSFCVVRERMASRSALSASSMPERTTRRIRAGPVQSETENLVRIPPSLVEQVRLMIQRVGDI